MFNYHGVDMERAMQAKKREILQELEEAKLRILKELSGCDKITLTRLRQVLDDYNKIVHAITEKINAIEQKVTIALETTNEKHAQMEENLETIDKIAKDYEEMIALVNELRETINEYCNQEDNIQANTTAIETLQNDIASITERLLASEGNNGTLSENYNQLAGRVATNETDISNIKTTIEGMQADGELSDGEILSLREKYNKLLVDTESLDERVTANETAIENVETVVNNYFGDGAETTIPESIEELKTQVATNTTNISELQTEVDNCFQSVSDGKTLVANAITDKGIYTANDATFATMSENIDKISTTQDYDIYNETIIVESMEQDANYTYLGIPAYGIYTKNAKLAISNDNFENLSSNMGQLLYLGEGTRFDLTKITNYADYTVNDFIIEGDRSTLSPSYSNGIFTINSACKVYLQTGAMGRIVYNYHVHTSACDGYRACGSTNVSEIEGSWDEASESYINSGRHCNTCGFEQRGGASWWSCPNQVWKTQVCGKTTSTIDSISITYS